MKYLLLVGLVTLVACSKNMDKQMSSTQEDEKQTCDFGLKNFNLSKRAPVNIDNEIPSKRPGTGGTTPPPTSNAAVILLDFNGQTVSGTSWNTNGNINCAPANLTAADISNVVQRVTNDYSPFAVTVTTDENVFNAASITKRMRVIITESWEWFGSSAGGTAYINSFTASTDNPCFVFSSLLNYDLKYIADAVSHEVGHTLGLRHQAIYDANCVMTSAYNWGQGSGETGWAPIMGSAYYQNLSLWHRGPNNTGCSNIQDDVAVIAGKVGNKADDYSNMTTGAASLATSLNGCINNSTDLDFFSLNLGTTKTVSVIPSNTGINNAGANLDLILRVYNSQGNLLGSFENPAVLNASTILNAGTYYISVGTSANPYTTTYGMLGTYTVSLN